MSQLLFPPSRHSLTSRKAKKNILVKMGKDLQGALAAVTGVISPVKKINYFGRVLLTFRFALKVAFKNFFEKSSEHWTANKEISKVVFKMAATICDFDENKTTNVKNCLATTTLPVQTTLGKDHAPFPWQTAVVSPTISNPVLQWYVMLWPNVYLEAPCGEYPPRSGFAGGWHVTSAK